MDLYQLKFPFRKFLSPVLKRMEPVHPDVVSYAAVGVAAVTGWCYYQATAGPALLIIAIALVFLRMSLNTLDGIMAIRRGNLSLRGEIVNALPDRYSDFFVLIGIALSPLCSDWLGMLAICSVILVSYSGMLGKALTVSWQHQGPLGKVERLILLMVFTLIQFLSTGTGVHWFGIAATPLEWLMVIYIILGQITVFRRVSGQVQEINRKEALERLDSDRNIAAAIVVYESLGGNTRLVAEQIAQGLGCQARHVLELDQIPKCELLVLGTPNIRRKPTERIARLLSVNPDRPQKLAVFGTFGLPVWGQITGMICLNRLAGLVGIKPLGSFACPGFHRKFKTFKGRPSQADLFKAFNFGLRLSKLVAHPIKTQTKIYCGV